ncbi:MAG: ABC transporter ATP-binding protein [Candidatus Rokubacteria bacterium]|nr:ABC transporter ATP-binding protein [Candidatus Rokubacteria bacterium]
MLEVRQAVAGYGKKKVLHGISLEIDAQEVVAVIGHNGAGKTTLLKTVGGLLRPRAGTVRWEGADLTRLHAHLIVERGLAQVPEGRRLFGGMTVEENLALGAFAERARHARAASLERVYGLFPFLRERRREIVRALSGGQQQMVAVGRALMSNPRLLILDEPSLGIAPRLVWSLLEALADINRGGVGIFIVEQNIQAALTLAHRGYLLESGRIVGEGAGRDLLRDPHVRRAYLGPLAVRE